MPELPEVESFKKVIDNCALGKEIDVVKILAPNMLLSISGRKLKTTLTGNVFQGTIRHGKFLFITLEKGGSLLLHFGLTGDVACIEAGETPPSRFVLQCHFADDSSFFFTDTRKLGKISLVENVEEFVRERRYGKDALKISLIDFIKSTSKKKAPIKSVLMDQKLVAGVGNEYSDEILFQTKIHPATPATNLTAKQLEKVYVKMVGILKEAVRKRADRGKLDQFFFLGHRKAGLICPRCSGKTAYQSIGGRSSYFCPKCQKLIEGK
jgi:formamidopyrimidine-DNA glycosylase